MTSEDMKQLGHLCLIETIQEINNKNNNTQESKAYQTFLQSFYENKDNEEIKNVASNYLFASYVVRKLYNVYMSSLNDFDRQSLKLSSVLNDMYLIENNISKLTLYNFKRKDLAQHIQIEEQAGKKIEKLIHFYESKKDELTDIEKEAMQVLIEKQTASNIIIEEEKKYIETSEKVINELRNNDDHISKNTDSEAIIGLIKIIFNTFSLLVSIEVLFEAIYKVFEIKDKVIFDNVFKLSSYIGMKERKDNLFKLAEDNMSIDKTFKKSPLYLLLNEYTKLDKTATKKKIDNQSNFIKSKIEDFTKYNTSERKLEGDIDFVMYSFLSECQDNFKKEMGW